MVVFCYYIIVIFKIFRENKSERLISLILTKTIFYFQINDLFESLKNNTDALFGEEVFKLINKYMPWLIKTLPQDYYKELIGISDIMGTKSVGEITLFNVFYEFFSVCTSIIVQEKNCGKLYLGRNLDFGLFLG